jgi:hypothetical protein
LKTADMTNVIDFPASPAVAGDAVEPAGSAKHGHFGEKLAVATQDTLKAMLAAIDSIALALDQVEIIRKALPEGPSKDSMQQQKAALTCGLFASRMLATHLSSDIARLVATSREADRTIELRG